MDYLLVLALLLAVFCWIALWFMPSWKYRAAMTLLYLLIVGTSGFLYHETLSRPKSLDFELIKDHKEAKLLKHIIEPNVALYLLLGFEGEEVPLYYYLPWSEETENLAKQIMEAEEQGSDMTLAMPFFYEPSLEKEKLRKIHPLPIPAMPPKEAPVIPGPTFEL